MKCVITERNSEIGQPIAAVMFGESRKQVGHNAERYVCNEQVICMYICVYMYVNLYVFACTLLYICIHCLDCMYVYVCIYKCTVSLY